MRVDSTAPHNRFLVAGQGALCERVITQVEHALDEAAPDALRVVLLHHHVLLAPTETFPERLADLIALPFANELALGGSLLQRLAGRADLVFHGHCHVPASRELPLEELHSLGVYNAGSSSELGAYRVFHHMGGIRGAATWHRLMEVPHALRLDRAVLHRGTRTRIVPRAARRALVASA